MSSEKVTVRNLVTRKVGKMSRALAESLISRGKPFEIVPEGTKSFVPLKELTNKKRPKPKPPVEDTDEKDEVEA